MLLRDIAGFTLLLTLMLISACGGGGSSSNQPSNQEDPPSPPQFFSMELEFERLDSSVPNPFRVTAFLNSGQGPIAGVANAIDVRSSKGSVGPLTEMGAGVYSFVVTPEQTGEHEITVEYEPAGLSETRTALVLAEVHEDWGQAMAVAGLVNTEGYEDGVTVSPDRQYLFVQYGPLYFSGLILFDLDRAAGGCSGDRLSPTRCTHPWFDETIGPTSAPERPGFFDGRFADEKWLHNSNSWGLTEEQSPLFAPSTMFYGFKHLGNGVYGDPFYIAFEDENDALINAYGLSVMSSTNNTARISYSVNDPANEDMVDLDNDGNDDVESFIDVFTTEITLGENTNLGTYVPSGSPGTAPVRSSNFPSTLVDFGKVGIDGIAGTQGNSHLYSVDGDIVSVWTDDEYDTGGDRDQISVYLLNSGIFPNGTWSKLVLPDAINLPDPSREFQPFFNGTQLYFTRATESQNPEIFLSTYSGDHNLTDFNDSSHWATPEKVLGVEPEDRIGGVIAIGEPTVAQSNGTFLYFVYGYIRAYDSASGMADINMQAGYIKLK